MKYIKKENLEKLNLPFKRNDIREDGYIFNYYYTRKGKIFELWNSPETMAKVASVKKIKKKEHTKKTKKYIKRVKLYLGCAICGYKKSSDALQFDHINIHNKTQDISRMSPYSFKTLKNEMRKCRVLCANCHAEHTQIQREKGLFNNEVSS
tara:strand:+ start:1387 stop:1839 length:453 start_codon:yes stop_codon:yes gene_type:complete